MAYAKKFRTGRRFLTLVLALLATGAASVIVAATPASATPVFHAPFACGTTWNGRTRPHHSSSDYLNPTANSYALDLNYGSGSADAGMPILASADGTAVFEGLGTNVIRIDHADGWVTFYVHGEPESFLTDGLPHAVRSGDVIGYVSNVGSDAVHLHYSQNQITSQGYVQMPVTFEGVTYVAPESEQLIYITSYNSCPFDSAPQPTISGDSTVFSTLTADTGTWIPAPTFSYQWYRAGAPIGGANSSSYVTTQDDIGQDVTVSVTGMRDGFQSATQMSAGFHIFPVGSFSFSSAPAVISGTPKVDFTLTSNSGITTPFDTSTIVWLKDGATRQVGGTSLALESSDIGANIQVQYTFTKAGYVTTSYTSPEVTIAGYSAFTFSGAPAAFIGTPKVDFTLTSSSGLTTPGVTTTITWLTNDAVRQTGYSNTLTLTAADIGTSIKVRYTYSKQGYQTTSYTSPAVTISGYSSYSFSGAPASLSGTAKVDFTLSASSGITTTGVTTSVKWLKNGVTRQTGGSTLTLTSSDIGASIVVRYTYSKQGYQTTSYTSPAVTVAGYSYFAFSGLPAAISGSPRYLSTLQAVSGLTTSGTTTSVVWLKNGVTRATGSTLKLASSDVGAKITARITFSKQGYQTISYTSSAVTVTW